MPFLGLGFRGCVYLEPQRWHLTTCNPLYRNFTFLVCNLTSTPQHRVSPVSQARRQAQVRFIFSLH